MIKRGVERRLKGSALQQPSGGSTGLRAVLFMALFGFSTLGSGATFTWDGQTYIPLGLQPRSETVIRMPEPINKWWPEEDEAINVNKIDDRTLSVSPRLATVEQRIFLRGESGKLYLAKASTRLKHVPVVEVTDATAKGPAAEPRNLAEHAPSTLMLKMMRDDLPAGFGRAKSARRILESGQYTIDATEVWSSPHLTGIVTTIARATGVGTTVEINPAQISIYILELGQLRIIGADKWILDDAAPSTKGYLVFSKG